MDVSSYVLLMCLLLLLGACGCSENNVVVPVHQLQCDTCDNYMPPPPGYSGNIAVYKVCHAELGKLSPNGKYVAYYASNADYGYSERRYPIDGFVVSEVATQKIVYFKPGHPRVWVWGPESHKIYMIEHSVSSLLALDVRTGEIVTYTSLGAFDWIDISPSGKILFLGGYVDGGPYSLVRWVIGASQSEFVTDNEEASYQFAVVSDSVICTLSTGPNKNALNYYNTENNRVVTYSLPSLSHGFKDMRARIQLSPDRSKLLFDAWGQWILDGYHGKGVWMVDLSNREVSQILARNPYYMITNYHPTWSTSDSFVASWYCRKDSTSMLYEYKLNGEPVKQITYRHTKFWETIQ